MSRLFQLIGGILAIILSYSVNHSILRAIFHFICGWLYVIYYIIINHNLNPILDFLTTIIIFVKQLMGQF